MAYILRDNLFLCYINETELAFSDSSTLTKATAGFYELDGNIPSSTAARGLCMGRRYVIYLWGEGYEKGYLYNINGSLTSAPYSGTEGLFIIIPNREIIMGRLIMSNEYSIRLLRSSHFQEVGYVERLDVNMSSCKYCSCPNDYYGCNEKTGYCFQRPDNPRECRAGGVCGGSCSGWCPSGHQCVSFGNGTYGCAVSPNANRWIYIMIACVLAFLFVLIVVMFTLQVRKDNAEIKYQMEKLKESSSQITFC